MKAFVGNEEIEVGHDSDVNLNSEIGMEYDGSTEADRYKSGQK